MITKKELILIRSQKIGLKDFFQNDVKPIFSFEGLMRFKQVLEDNMYKSF